MKHIVKKISLEQFRSRMPSVIQAFDGYGESYEFVEDSFYSEPYTNYGMFPCDVMYKDERLTFSELTERFHFCEKYYDILKSGKCRETPYANMSEYWEYERGNSKYTQEECLDMDVTFETYDGKEFYDYASANYFPRFEIPIKYREFWKCKYLYLPDVLKWIKWFNDNKETTDQCVRRQYCLLGGNDGILQQLETWFSELNIQIAYPKDNYCSYIYLPIQFSNSIENSGDFSLLAPEWQAGYDYSVGSASTVVSYDGETYAYSDKSKKGYVYDEEFKEILFDESAWAPTYNYFSSHSSYTPYVSAMKDNEGKDISTYAYHKDGAFIYNPDPELMCEGYLINDNDKLYYIERDGNIYPLFKSDYITVDGEIYVVNYEQLNLNPWVTIKGKIYRGTYTENGYIFSIASQDNIPITSQGTLYQYNNHIYLPTEKDNKIDGYIEIDGHQYLIKDNKLTTDIFGNDLKDKELSASSKGYIVDIEEGIVKIYEPYEVYTATIVSGETESKLSSLECLGGYLYDNIGNKMPGMLLTSDEPITSDTVLVPTYKSGQTAHLSDLGDGLYWGDYLAEVKCDSTAQTYTFVYYIGCEITKDESTKNYVMKNGGFEGVKYTETVPYIVKTCQYYLDNKEYVTLKYNSLEFEQIVYPNNDYDNTVLSVNKAHFKYNTTLNITDDFMLSPVIKDEHKIGINGPENIEADIYINRGVARAYDYHLKLMETKTFDALENYGNSWFKII